MAFVLGRSCFHVVGEKIDGDLAWVCNRNRPVDPDDCWEGWQAQPSPLCRRCERILSAPGRGF